MKNSINTIPEALSNAYLKRASKTAMILNNGNKITYNDMMWDISMTCSILKDNGIKKDSKVALFMDKTPQCVETFLAIIKTGAVVLLLDYSYSENQIAEIIASENPDLIFVKDSKLDLISKGSATVLGIEDNRLLRKVDSDVSRSVTNLAKINGNDNAIVTFTVTDNDLLERNCLTHEAFVKLTTGVKKTSNPMDSLVSALKATVAPLLKGAAVKASV
ncbi:MAG: AMP-binding protein [Treponema sp.]|uniref:AMP-binding protein n=1 Tax=Treponema sp. TaxID=166 RepID=UPI001D6B9034|nr:AMP-binding protein [Treponema sp.]MBS7309898.1 AMP-binding protein [Treponema sp.]MDY5886400.1 AMP-binding protein [Treponema sp.]